MRETHLFKINFRKTILLTSIQNDIFGSRGKLLGLQIKYIIYIYY